MVTQKALVVVGRPGLRPDALWADLNTASPGTKHELAELAASGGTPFADVSPMPKSSAPPPEA